MDVSRKPQQASFTCGMKRLTLGLSRPPEYHTSVEPVHFLTDPTPRYMESSRPLGHPTPAEMEPPQLEQALALAEMARERCKLSYFSGAPSLLASEDGSGPSPGGGAASTGVLPLALAWEGSALALLAARGEMGNHGLRIFAESVVVA